ncbi:dihydrofolate reductase family protein [Dactylosporangium sp. McL0621]|uniref:dihydrofolate reductase family protein n=1 Tax=Dactylosporangium sp. McL0621 TaxID=3415678 RepID=UPI003CF54AD6
MRKLVVSQFLTLDGVMQGPGDDPGFDRSGWAFRFDRGAEGHRFKLDEVMSAGGLLLGRATYDGFAAAWPSRTDEAGFAERMNTMPKYVISATLQHPVWNNTTVISGDIADEVTRLKEQAGNDLLVNGSGMLVRTLAERGLVDEYRLMVYPTVVGAGRRLFDEGFEISALRLASVYPVGPDGVVIVTYHPVATT